MASLSGAAARSTPAGDHATAMQRCLVQRLSHRGITAQAASSASGPQRKAAQRSDSSVRSPLAVASSKDKDSQAANEAGPEPAMRAAQKAPLWRLAAPPLLLLLACWLLPLPVTQPWPADVAVRLAVVAVVAVVFVKQMQALKDQQYVESLLHDKPPAALTAELARKFRYLKQSAEFTACSFW